MRAVAEDYRKGIKRVRKPIKCKRCKHARTLGDGRLACTLRTEMQHLVEPSDWCSRAERKETGA